MKPSLHNRAVVNDVARAIGSVVIAAVAIGALAFGAVAVGAFAVGRLAIGRARIRRLEIDELVIRKSNGSGVPSDAARFVTMLEIPPMKDGLTVVEATRS
jgi:carbonic anhydrase/acetyltransferase-like protein (isoleucine patch superfamily)